MWSLVCENLRKHRAPSLCSCQRCALKLYSCVKLGQLLGRAGSSCDETHHFCDMCSWSHYFRTPMSGTPTIGRGVLPLSTALVPHFCDHSSRVFTPLLTPLRTHQDTPLPVSLLVVILPCTTKRILKGTRTTALTMAH